MTTPAQPGQPHARQRATPKAAAANRAAQASASQQKAAARQAGKPKPGAGKPPKSTKRQRAARAARSTRRAHDAAWFAAGRITGRTGSQPGTSHLLAAELLAGAAIVAVRALGDYQLTDEGTQRGTLNTPGNGGYGPFTVLAGLVASFFALSFLAAGGGKRAKAATAFGALIIVVLMIKSMDEIQIVGNYITADPASRTVTAAAYSSNAAQPWGLAWQVSSGATTTLQSSSSLAAYGAPYSAAAPAAAAGGASSGATGGTSSGSTSNLHVATPPIG